MELKLNLPQLHHACAKDPMRPALEHIMIKDGYAYATNAHILVKAKLSEFTEREEILELIEGKYIHRDTWKQIYNKACLVKDEKLFCIDHGMFVEFKDVEKFPNVDAVIPKGELEDVKRICFRHEFFNLLSKALKRTLSEGATLKFHGASRAIVVGSNDGFSESFGIIMPIMLEN